MGLTTRVQRPLLRLGAVLFLLAGVAYGMLEIHQSTDTWIGLAAGRQIVELGHVPTTDSFSFTFSGQPWYNQNWGTHWLQYRVHEALGPDAVIYLTWGMVLATVLLVLLACYWRSGSWLAATLAAALVGFACRDFVSARPATTGFLCIAALAALLAALEGQGGRRLRWPIAALLPLLLAWGAVHGSFMFGYGLIGLYLAHALLAPRLGWPPPAIEFRQVVAIAAVTAVALLATIAVGPFGIANFTHGEKIASSSVFRAVAEWKPALQSGGFPGMWRIWLVGAVAIVALVVAAATSNERGGESSQPTRVRLTAFDLAVVGIGVGMTLWARRFAPIALMFGAIATTTWIVARSGGMNEVARRRIATWLMILCWPAAAALAWDTTRRVQAELIDRYEYEPGYDLLERVTRFDEVPHDAIAYLGDNEVPANLFVEWSQAGPAMFLAPRAKVFIDGRAQQLYDERIYMTYVRLVGKKTSMQDALAKLASPELAGVDAFLLRTGAAAGLTLALGSSADWQPVYSSQRDSLFLRRGSAGLQRVEALRREGRERLPD